VKQKLLKALQWALYPLFYLFCLAIFGYFTFPYDRLKDRAISEFARAEAARPGSAPKRLEIDHLSSYWLSGVEVEGARLILPPDPADETKAASEKGEDDAKAAPKDTTIEVSEAHARLRLLPLVLGRLNVDFWAAAFGGEVEGVVPIGASSGPVEITIEDVELGQLTPLTATLGLPLKGTLGGAMSFLAAEGKFSKGTGDLDLKLAGVSVGDGKTKIGGQLALPEAKIGELAITAEAKSGVLTVTQLGATGGDVDLIGDGKVTIRDRWDDSIADLYVRFKFADSYRDKNDVTRSLLGAPGTKTPALLDLDPRVKRAKRPDGFYGWHVTGPLKKLKFEPTTADGPAPRPGRGKTTEKESPATPPKPAAKTAGSPMFPLGTSKARPAEATGAAVPPQPEVPADAPVQPPPRQEPGFPAQVTIEPADDPPPEEEPGQAAEVDPADEAQ
jgi:type II secretion system protein N